MTAPAKISSCVDCATPIIGERLRCPACHDQHAVGLLSGEDDVTVPRKRQSSSPTIWQSLVAWIAVVQLFAIVVILLILAGKACQ